jgi:hypothetical protein
LRRLRFGRRDHLWRWYRLWLRLRKRLCRHDYSDGESESETKSHAGAMSPRMVMRTAEALLGYGKLLALKCLGKPLSTWSGT